jgi:hypothetical protein
MNADRLDYTMRTTSDSRFEAQTVGRLTTVSEGRRFEMEFADSEGKKMVLSLPMSTAVELGCMICDVSDQAPYLVGGVRPKRFGTR